uniref:DH domain-containing protein n=1 Tax=Syphacia muris TaxID=451379 RepID=A0A0N5B1B9_9BILA
EKSGGTCSDNVIIVPHVQISENRSHLFNRAISSGDGILADLQRATIAAQTIYADNLDHTKNRSSWVLKRLHDWSHRAKSRELLRHVQAALVEGPADKDFDDEDIEKLLTVTWNELFSVNENLLLKDRKRLQAIWELFNSELKYFVNQLLVLKNVFKEPLKKCQVEGILLSVEPDLLFGNLDQLCRISRGFCKSFLSLLQKSPAQEKSTTANTTELVVQLFEKFCKVPSNISAYQAYCINYKTITDYLATIRHKEERFLEFERVCLSDPRCARLQLEDLLIAPLQRITRLPILLKEIYKYTNGSEEQRRIERVTETISESLRSINDSVQWLHNFERLQQLQSQVIWPSILDMEPRCFIPDFLKAALSRQFCENLLAHPRRRLVHEGHLEFVESGKTTDCYAFLFNDMFLLTKMKKLTTKLKRSPCQLPKSDHYIVHKQPIPLDSCVFCDVDSADQTSSVVLKFAFVIIHLTRYYQVVSVYTFQTANKTDKDTWIEKFQEAIENYESIQLKDMLKCTPLFSNLNFQRLSSSRLMSTFNGTQK